MSLNKILMLQTMAVDNSVEIRRRAAKHILLPKRLMLLLSEDIEDGVVETLFENPGLDEGIKSRLAKRLGKEYVPATFKMAVAKKAVNTHISVDKIVQNTKLCVLSNIIIMGEHTKAPMSTVVVTSGQAGEIKIAEISKLAYIDRLLNQTKLLLIGDVVRIKEKSIPTVVSSLVNNEVSIIKVDKMKNMDTLFKHSIRQNLRLIVESKQWMEFVSGQTEELFLENNIKTTNQLDARKVTNLDILMEKTNYTVIKDCIISVKKKEVSVVVENYVVQNGLQSNYIQDVSIARIIDNTKQIAIKSIVPVYEKPPVKLVFDRENVALAVVEDIKKDIVKMEKRIVVQNIAGSNPKIKSASFYLKRFT